LLWAEDMSTSKRKWIYIVIMMIVGTGMKPFYDKIVEGIEEWGRKRQLVALCRQCRQFCLEKLKLSRTLRGMQ